MKVYLASQYARKPELQVYAEELQDAGIKVTSRWLTDEPAALSQEEKVVWARYDLQDVDDADILVFFAEHPEHQPRRGGRHVEFGYALGRNKTVLVIGGIENIFHNLPYIQHFDNFEQVKNTLKALEVTGAY